MLDPEAPADSLIEGAQSGQGAARRALQILLTRDGFRAATARQKRVISEAFASTNRPVYGQAFDAIRFDGEIDLDDVSSVKRNISRITLYEIKATNRASPDDFAGHFFSMTTAELLVAQKLGHQFRFAFVNVNTGVTMELSLTELYARARAIYPTWSIRF